jgi:hypothetical protein
MDGRSKDNLEQLMISATKMILGCDLNHINGKPLILGGLFGGNFFKNED